MVGDVCLVNHRFGCDGSSNSTRTIGLNYYFYEFVTANLPGYNNDD